MAKIKYIKVRKDRYEELKKEIQDTKYYRQEFVKVKDKLVTLESRDDWQKAKEIEILQNELRDWKILAGGFCPNRNPFEGKIFSFPHFEK